MRLGWVVCGMVLGVAAQGARAVDLHPPRRQPVHRRMALKPHPEVALTFDDMPAAGGLPAGETRAAIATRLADELLANHIRGVYGFVNAVGLDQDPDMQKALRIWVDKGMRIGNHTWSHPEYDADSAAAYEHEIALDQPDLRAFAQGHDWRWFRFPYLEEGNTAAKWNDIHDWLREHHYRVAEVTLNFNDDDWSDPYNRCMVKHDTTAIAWLKQSYMQNAAEFLRVDREEQLTAFGHEIPNVLLLHETVFTTLMLPDLLKLLHQNGFRITTLPKVERNRAYSMDPGIGLPGGGSLTNEFLDSRRLPYPQFAPEPEQQLDKLCR